MIVPTPTPPRRTYETGVVTRVLRVLAPLGWLVVTILVLHRYPDLPATIPTHLGPGGEVSTVGPRWSVLVLLGIFWAMVGAVAWLSRRPGIFTYPVEVTSANAQDVYREGERQMVWVNLALVVVGSGVVLAVLGHDGVGMGVVWAGLAALLGVVALGVVRSVRAARRDA